MTRIERQPRAWGTGASVALALVCASATAQAADFALTVTEDTLNTYANSIEAIQGEGEVEVPFYAMCEICMMKSSSPFFDHCLSWEYQICKTVNYYPWTWKITSADFEVTPSGIQLSATVKVEFQGDTHFVTIQRAAYSFYQESSGNLFVLLDFDFLGTGAYAEYPIYSNAFGEGLLLGTIAPFRFFNAVVPIGVANVSLGDKTVSGVPTNVQVILQHNQMKVQGDVDFSS